MVLKYYIFVFNAMGDFVVVVSNNGGDNDDDGGVVGGGVWY